MILDRYIFKELFKSQFVVLLVLISIFAAQSLIRLVTDAASGDMPAVLITKFLLFSLPEFLSLLLPLTLYVSIIITLGRICSDSEMVVMRAVGFSPKRIMSVALMLGIMSASLAAYISLVLTPKAAIAMQELEVQATQNPEFLPIDSGRFVSFGKYNIYVEDVQGVNANDKQVNNVYVIDSENINDELSITVARRGHIVVDEEGVRWLVLNDGRRYENPADGSFRIGNFSQFKAPLSGNITDASSKTGKLNTMSSFELLQSSDLKAQVEFQWRMAPVFAVLVMCMVAVPLSMVNPRQGRFTRLMPAIIIYVAYYLFLLSLRNMLITGSLPVFPGLYLVPLCFLIFVAIPLNMPKTYIKQKISGSKASRQVAKAQEAQEMAAEAKEIAEDAFHSTWQKQQIQELSKDGHKSDKGRHQTAVTDKLSQASPSDALSDSAKTELTEQSEQPAPDSKAAASVIAPEQTHPSGQVANVAEIMKELMGGLEDDDLNSGELTLDDSEASSEQRIKHGLPSDLGSLKVSSSGTDSLKIEPVSGTQSSGRNKPNSKQDGE